MRRILEHGWVGLGIALCIACTAVCAETPLAADGVTEPVLDAQLTTSVAGIVSRILFREGDEVKKGDVILELQKELEELEVARRKLVWESQVELKAAEARIETVKQDLEATKYLFHTTKSISKEKLLEKELDYKIAVAELDRLKVAEDLQKIEHAMAAEQLERRQVRAPTDGVITKLFVDAGEGAEPGKPILRLVNTRSCHFVTNVDAKRVRDLRLGQEVDLEIEAGKVPVQRKGKIDFISPVVDPASGLQEVKVLFDNTDGEVRPGVAGIMHVGVKEDGK
jgi:RND family efflux transporter MFP subunit